VSYNIEVNLYQGWVSHLRDELTQFGYNLGGYGEHEIVITYLNLLRRLVQPIPRTVCKSREFQCPAEFEPALKVIEGDIAAGKDLSPYLSRRLRNQDYNDPLLNDWGIHHLHLSTKVESDGFVERTGPLLFCRFDGPSAYFINVLPHGSWTDSDMVRVLHKNWPESIQQFRAQGVLGLARQVTDQDRKILRAGNVNSMVEVERGVVYVPLGWGMATSGVSTEVVRQAHYCESRLGDLQATLIRDIDEIAEAAAVQGLNLPENLKFNIHVKGPRISVIEPNCGLRVYLGDL